MLERRRIMIADDQKPTRQGLHALLSFLPGMEWVGEAENGREAVHLMASLKPDVVLMDARMPVMNGIEATRQIKSSWPKVKVVMLTLYAEYEAEAMAAGADIFLVKGGPPEALQNAICLT